MSRRIEKPGPKPRILAATVVAVTAMGLTACAAGTSAAAPTTTVTQTLQASPALPVSSAAAIPSAQASGSADSSSAGRLPDYRPSTVVSKSEYSTVLTSPDSASKVGEFYRTALAAGGWHVTSSSMSAYQASFSANRSNEGVNVSVYPRGSGSGISISTHPAVIGARHALPAARSYPLARPLAARIIAVPASGDGVAAVDVGDDADVVEGDGKARAAGNDEPVADGHGEVEAAELGPIACHRRTAAIADLRFRWRLGCS